MKNFNSFMWLRGYGLKRVGRILACLTLLLTLACGNVWGSVATFSGSNLNAAAGDKTVGSITLSTSTMTYSSGLYASGAGKTFTLTASGGATISQVLITMSGTSNRYAAANITNCTSCTRDNSVYTCTISPATSSVSCTNNGGGVTITQLEVTYSGGASTKRIYMKCGSTWCDANPKFYAHSWGSSDSDVELTLADCETDVYYADIPSGNTSVVFTRQNPSSTGIAWSGDNFWNQSEDITISTNNKFTCTGWNNNKGTFSGGTYSAPTYTISFNAGGGSSSMSSISSIACGADQALPANEFTYAGHTFAGWHADVATTVSGSPVAAGSDIADEATLQNITSNIALTAQWEEIVCPESGSVFSLGGWSTSNTSSWTNANNSTVTITGLGTLSGGTATAVSIESSKKPATNGSGDNMAYSLGYNNVALYCALDCNLEAGDVITIVSNGSHSNTFILTTTNSRSTSVTTSCSSGTNTYTVTGSDILHGQKNVYIWRSSSTLNIKTINITRTASCDATQPGAISKGTLSGCTMRLTASGSPASNNSWYWQASASGTSTSESGATKDVTTPGTYYIRSYYSTGTCWSDAREVTVSASDLTPAAPTGLTAASTTAKGTTFTVADAANTNNYDFYVSTSSTAPVAGTGATYTETSKTLTITDKVAGTTYYAWVRAVCGSYKSDWTALTGNTFTTSTVTVTHTLTNVSKTSGGTTAGGSDYTAVYTADAEYSMPTPTVTIGGNAATSGTDYTWSVVGSVGTITIPANKINGNIAITLNSADAAPSSAVISGTYHYFPEENISLTCTPSGNNGPTTYQWYKGGKADGNAIDGATSATYTKNSCAFADAGKYYCKVTCNETSIWAETNDVEDYDVKILHLYVNTGRNGTPYNDIDFVKVDGSTATASISLGANWDYGFNIADGCGHYYGNSGKMTEDNCTDWSMDVDGTDCLMRTTNGATYTFTVDYSNLEEPVVSISYPSANQAADKVIYFDNQTVQWSTLHYRIGRSDHTQATAMTKVSGTNNLYSVTTAAYNNFSGWHIANNAGWTGSNSIYRTYTNGDAYSITYATAHEGGAVTDAAVTVTPTTSRGNGSDVGINDNCEFYNYSLTTGMKTDRVTISPYSNGTITVNYTNTSNVASTLTSGNADLAHSVILTSITAVPDAGYDASAITINGGAYSANYVVTGATTIAASFTPHVYTITLNKGDHGASNQSAYVAYLDDELTSITHVTSTGYTLTGYYDGSTKVLNANGSFAGTDITGYIEDGVWTKTANATLTAKWEVKTTTLTFDPNTANHGTAGDGGATATYDATALSSVTHTTPAAGYQLDGYYTTATGVGTKIVTASGTLVASTSYTTAGGAWNSELANLTLYARYTDKSYSVTHTFTDASRTSGGSAGASAATHGTDYSVIVAATSGYTLPSTITVTIGGETATSGTEYTWNQASGTVTIGGSYITGDIVITITSNVECPASASGAVVYKFAVKSNVSDGNICSSQNVAVSLNTTTHLTTLTGGTLEGLVTSSSMNNLAFSSGRIQYANGSAGVLILTLDCAVKTGDIIRFVNYSSGNSKYNYLRHTSNSTTTNQITLNANNGAIQEIVVPSAFNDKDVLYIVAGSNTTGISYFEIIRPYVVTLDASTNGGKVGGANTATYYAASGEEIVLPHAFKADYSFNGWFAATTGGVAVSNPYTPTGTTTLYAQFGDCPSSGTVYKFQVADELDNGGTGITSLTDINIGNYLSELVGGTLEGYATNASYLSIAGNNSFSFENNGTYLKITLDCALQTGDKFKSTTANKKFVINTSASTSGATDLTLGTEKETDVPAGFVGAKTLYIYRSGSNTPSPTISYFEIIRPEGFAVTYHKNDGSATTQVNTVSTVEDNMFTRNGYTFVKWHTEADGTSGVDKAVGAAVTAAIDLYAIWECTTPTFGTDLSTTPHVVREGDDAVTLTVAASANSGTVTYQWYSNTSKSTSGATALTTGATYNAPTSSLGTLYYYCVATNTTGGGCTAQSAYATVTVNEAPCFEFKAGTTKAGSGWDVPDNGAITTALWTDGSQVLTGGTLTNTSGSSLGGNASYGLVYAASGNKQVTVALTGDNILVAGSVITITGYSNNSTDACGFTISGNNMSPATYTPASTNYTKFTQTYTVVASDGVEGEDSFTIDPKTNIRVYLNAITITGCGERVGYTISFEGNGNTGGSMSDVTEIEEGDNVTLDANGFTKNGYTFANWTADVAVTVNSATVAAGDPIADQETIENVSSDITLTAQWTPNTYDITYNLNGASWAGGYSAPANYTVGTGATLPLAGNMTNTGYTFVGWYDNSDLTGSVVTAISTSDYGDKEYWAKWTENEYTITYDANNVSATGSTSDTEGHYVTVADCGFELAGHMFAGWNTKSDGTGDPYSAGDEIELTANMTLYAQWGDDYTISWDASAKLNGVAATPNLGGGNYTITASVADWTGTLTTSMISALTDGVTITNVAVDNSSSPKTITATFNVGASVAGESISFELDVPAAGDFGAKSSTKDIDIDRCTGSGSGSDGVLFSAEFKDSGLGTSNICAAANTAYTFTTTELKSAPTGGSIKAYTTDNLGHMKFATNAISIAGSNGVIQIDLDNAIQTYDLFTYVNVNSSSSSAYLRHTSADNTTDQIALTVYNSKEVKVMLPAGYNGKKTLFLVRNSNNFNLHKAAVVRPAFLMLLRDDTPTSDTNLEGTDQELTTGNYLTTIQGGRAYYTSPSSGNLKIKRSNSKNYINFNSAAGYVMIVLNDALQEGDVIGFDSYNTNNLDFTTTAEHTSVITTTNQLYTVNSSSALKGKTTFYIWQHSGSSDYLRGLQIARSGIAGGGGGSDQITPTLTWTPALESDADWDGTNSRLAKETGDADFTFTVTQDKNSLGAITYASSNTSVATVTSAGKVHIVGAGEATITATMAESGCYEEATAEYDIYVVDNCEDEAGTITVKDLGCATGYELTVSGHTIGDAVTYQWYKDGESMGGSYVAAKCTVTVAGEYYVVVDNTGSAGSYHCAMASTNTITIEATETATASAIVDEWYIKNGRRTPDIALVQTENATDFTVKSGSTDIWNSDGSVTTGFAGCGFYLGTDGIIYLKGQKADGTAPSGLTAGDETLTFIATSCGGNADDVEITIHKQAATTRPSVAFVVDGTNKGDFDAENEDHSVGTALYDYLDYTRNGSGADGLFDLTPQNVYSTVDEKAIRQHYSQFDAIIITDDPSTSTKIGKKSCVDAFGTMIDIRPILTMEAYVSSLANWKAKGISGNPTSPNPRQYAMKLECKDHAIFSGLDPASDNVEVETVDGVDYWTVTMVDKTKTPYDGLDDDEETGGAEKPALQGFSASNVDGLLLLGEISEGALYTGVERQDEPAARLMLLGVQYKALPSALTPEGLIVIKNALNYLLETDMEEVDDCSNYFTDATGDHLWSTNGNWSKGKAPDVTVKARILKPCIITGTAYAAQVDIATGGKSSKGGGIAECTGKLTIDPTGALIVGGEVRAAEAPYFNTGELKPTTANNLVLNTNGSNQSALIFNNDKGDTKATVNLYSLGRKPSSYLYQYFAIPMESLPVNPTFANETHGGTKIYTYAWEEGTSSWTRRKYYDDLYAFEGLGITTNSTADYMSYTMTGNLASTAERVVMLTYDGVGNNIIGNSYTAPINIASLITAFASDEHVTKTVYVYCAGRDASTGTGASGSTETAGQWLAIPMEASGWEAWKGLKVIPAMQAFLIQVTAETSMTLNYDEMVRSNTANYNAYLRAPMRSAGEQETTLTRLRVADSQTHTDLYLFEGEQFSESFDNGWEATYMEGDGRSAKLYAQTETGDMAVAALPELEGTVLGFAPGKETEYTFTFSGAENGYYLNDLKLTTSVLINEANSYEFIFEDGDTNRFYISRTPINAPAITTGVENTKAEPKAQKVIVQDKMYILYNGHVYSAQGAVVR